MENISLEGLPFGDLLKTLRKRQRVKQQELARRMGKHINTIGTWERGECLPHAKSMVLELAKVLHLTDQETRQLLEASLTAPVPYWHVPYPRNPFFTGRTDLLEILHTRLYTHQAGALTQLYALHGLGGIGKTQLAVEYAYRHILEYQAIFWIEAEDAEAITRSFLRIAEQIRLPERQDPQCLVKAVYHWLSFHSHWLLIWDNVGDLDLLQHFFPATCQGSMLITTRRQTLGTIAQTLEVPPLPLHEGMLLLFRRAKVLPILEWEEHMNQLVVDMPGEHAAAQELAILMGGLPLALDQAGAYIDETGCSLSNYLQLYRQQQTQLLNRRGTSGSSHPHSVTTTFALAIQRLKQDYPEAADLLQLCAFLHPHTIPEEIFTEGARHLDGRLASIAKDPILLDEALAVLGTYSLLRRRPTEGMLSIHCLVQAVLLETIAETERHLWAERAISAINVVFPHAIYDTWSQCERLLPQALTAVQTIQSQHILNEEAERLLSETTFYLQNRARYTEAELLFQQVLEMTH